MYVFENPVLQRELLVNLRTGRSFLLLAMYQLLLAAVVLAAWPADQRLDLTQNPPSARRLVNLFFLGQYVLASLIAPSFAAGAISGEKERKTYEMLLASPLRPAAIVLGKMVASLTHLGMLVIASLPIIVLCLPLGGVSLYEVLAAYLGLIISVLVFGAIGVAASSYFKRTMASLVVSYLAILPLVILGVLLWWYLEDQGALRLKLAMSVVPAYGVAAVVVLCSSAAARMLYPPDVGSEGEEVVDLEREATEAIGLVIQRDQFPDRLFAPPKKQRLMRDGANPVYDKEIHSEIFSQGTLMLRLVIQISMLLAIPLMAVLLFAQPHLCPWYVVYVVVFNLLIGPVFSAGAITGERERQTLDLLLTTVLTPWQILWGKLIVGLRVSTVLTGFLLWPLLLAAVMVSEFWSNWPSVLAMFAIVLVACVSGSAIAQFCSTMCRSTAISLLAAYTILLTLYALPAAVLLVLQIVGFAPSVIESAQWMGIASPFSAAFALPLNTELAPGGFDSTGVAPVSGGPVSRGNVPLVIGYFLTHLVMVAAAIAAMHARLARRSQFGE